MNPFKAIIVFLCGLFLAACSGSKEFRIDAVSDDIGTQNVTLIYADGNSYRTHSIPAVDGQFSLQGTISGPTLVEVFTANGSPLGELIISGGDNIKARLSALNPENISIEGNDDSEILVEFMAKNRDLLKAGNPDALNRAIEDAIREEPDCFASTVLLTRYYTLPGYEDRALELLKLIPEKYRPVSFCLGFEQLLTNSLSTDTVAVTAVRGFSTADTARVFTPAGARYNLIMLSDDKSRLADSIRSALAVLRGGSSPEILRITDMACERDTMLWHSTLRNIPADYPAAIDRLWIPGGPSTPGIAETAPMDIPCFILTDSTGRLLFRSPSVSAARQAFGAIRKKH